MSRILFIILQLLFFIIFIICEGLIIENEKYPKIIISIGSNEKYIMKGSNSFNFSDHFDEIYLKCISTYPTKWTFSSNPLKDGSLTKFFIDKTRNVLDINNMSTYTFISELTLRFKNPIIHEYVSCGGAQASTEQERNLNTTVYLNTTSSPRHTLRVIIESGTVLKPSDKKNRLGSNINCTLFLHFDINKQKYGCSSIQNEPSVKIIGRIVQCNDNDECSAIIRMDKCGDKSIINTCEISTCVEMPKNKPSPGAIICELGKLSIARTVFMTVDKPPSYYMKMKGDDDVVNVSQVLKLELKKYNQNLFEPESISFYCFGSASYFSRGFRWAIQYDRDIIEYIEPTTSSRKEDFLKDQQVYRSEIEIHPNKSMNINRIIICYAPIWNSYKWENVSFLLEINAIPPPDLMNGNITDTTTVLEHGSVTMSCRLLKSNDVPPVIFTWMENDKILKESRQFLNDKKFSINDNGSGTGSNLTIFDVSMNANYTCIAKNKKGKKSEKYYIVIVTHPSTMAPHKLIIIIGVAIVFILLILILLLFLNNLDKNKTIQNLSDDDILEFVNGDQYSNNDTSPLFYPYNDKYEICRKDFQIESKILGKGQFGIVFKGRLGIAPIAIKSIRKGAEICYVKSLLSELKIMSFVGRHDNIVCLIGACTENISKCELYILCEFCTNGNILKYLKDSREIFIDFSKSGQQKYGSFRNSITDYQNSSVKKISSKDLLRWAYEIACGMEFLSSKTVVHGDLAARNILLTEDLTAKVGDFGLSKQLLTYSVYVQRQGCPLPLRWMAIESLQDLEFSIQSDVWSYGVTLWEIFTLGRTPYPGVSWDFESWKMLRDGYRMDKPQYASEITYKTILKCWEIDLNRRPNFTWLKDFFTEQYNLFVKQNRISKIGFK